MADVGRQEVTETEINSLSERDKILSEIETIVVYNDKMRINIRGRFKNITSYRDRPNSAKGNIGEALGIFVLFLFVGSFLYLVITGMPTILLVLKTFVQVTTQFFQKP